LLRFFRLLINPAAFVSLLCVRLSKRTQALAVGVKTLPWLSFRLTSWGCITPRLFFAVLSVHTVIWSFVSPSPTPRLKRHNTAASHAKHVFLDRQGINASGLGLLLRRRRLRYLGRLWGLPLPHEGHDARLLLYLVLDRRCGRLSCALGKLIHHALSFKAVEFSQSYVWWNSQHLPVYRSVEVLYCLWS
jgi:hypothetical protein